MSIRHACAGLSGLALTLIPLSESAAHEIVGNRFFPATLGIDDPGVNDELAFPTVASFKTGDDPSFRQRDFSAEFAKRITEDFAISVSLSVEWGGSGVASVGAEPFNTYTPTIYFGKGFGDLPDTLSWIRPVAVTGQFGYAIPGRSSTTTFGIDPDSGATTADTEFNPRVLNWGGTLQYSMPYLKSAVRDLGLPEFINHLIPLVEANLQTPVANTLTSGRLTTGTINPGVIWVGNTFQVGIEALIPINRQSGTNVGVIAQLHFFLDNIDPHGIGKPIFGNAVQPASLFPRN